MDYYLATKACLSGEYYPLGERADFEDVSVQRLFYQNVVKRLEDVIFKAWGIRLEDLSSFDSKQNESCWGSIGREVVRLHTGNVDFTKDANNTAKVVSPNGNNTAKSPTYRSNSDTGAQVSYASLHSDLVLRMPAKPSSASQAHGHRTAPSEKTLYFFDATHQTGFAQE